MGDGEAKEPIEVEYEVVEESATPSPTGLIRENGERSSQGLPPPPPTPKGRGRVVTVTNQKGGVGKTTSVINIAAHLASGGLRVLIVDCDLQGNCATGLGIDKNSVTHGTEILFRNPEQAAMVRHATPIENLHMFVGGPHLVGIEQELASELGREKRLEEALEPLLSHYDLVLIDTPPSLGLLTINALAASDGVLVPVQTEYFSLEGLSILASTLQQVRKRLNPRLGVDGLCLTMHAPTMLNSQVASEVREVFGEWVVEPPIRRNIRLAEASSQGTPIHVYAPTSNGGQDYRTLSANLAVRWGLSRIEGDE